MNFIPLYSPAEYREFLVFSTKKHTLYPLILSYFPEDYKYIKKGTKKILSWIPEKEPFVINIKLENTPCFLILKKGEKVQIKDLIEVFLKAKYTEYEKVYSEKEFSKRGFILDFFPEQNEFPLRIEFFGEEIEEIRIFDPNTQKKIEKIEYAILFIPPWMRRGINVKNLTVPESFFYIKEEKISKNDIFSIEFDKDFRKFIDYLKKNKNKKIIYVGEDRIKFSYIKNIVKNMEFLEGRIQKSFEIGDENKIIISENEIFPMMVSRKRFVSPFRQDYFFELQTGDKVILEDEGICSFRGIKRAKLNEIEIEQIELVFKDNQKLFLPFWEIYRIEKYLGHKDFTDYSSKSWVKGYVKMKREVYEFAKKLVKITARRKTFKGFSFKITDPELKEIMREVIASFPYTETQDQRIAWEEIERDMDSEKRMERVLIGDAGFGKTEMALRASVKASLCGKQVLFIAPTAPLAYQHYINFKKRLEKFPFNVRMLSRLTKSWEVKELLEELRRGKVDILIATHRGLSEDVKFKDLGLLIIDEEQKFGTAHKEKMKILKEDVDTLLISATPIPRTIAQIIYGIKDVSRIRIPPPGRKEIEVIIVPYSAENIRGAIERELERKGQVIYIKNRIKALKEIKNRIDILFPYIRSEIIHGRMNREKIENILLEFIKGNVQILITTSILEIGMDFENVNTLIVERPDLFGLSELYSLKGRIGRRDRKAFFYILIPKKLGEKAKERIKIIKRFNFPGAGEKISVKDLEMRGPGELLGRKQKGFIKYFGIEFYLKLLEEEIKRLRGEFVSRQGIKVRSYASLCFPDYVLEEDKIHILRAIFTANSVEEIELLEEEYRDMYGRIDENVKRIFELARVFLIGRIKGVKEIVVMENRIIPVF